MGTPPEISAPDTMRCYRHPGRETLISCSNCDRPICTECMTSAAVGFRCPECAGRGRATSAVQRLPRPASTVAMATSILVGLNLLVYLVEVVQSSSFNVGNAAIIYDWALFGPAVADGEWYRIVTSGFLHSGLIHIGFNMYLLWILGGALERYAGAARMLAIYFSSLLWGSALVLIMSPNALTVGASGGGVRADGRDAPAGAPARDRAARFVGRGPAPDQPAARRSRSRTSRSGGTSAASPAAPRPGSSCRATAAGTWPTAASGCPAGPRSAPSWPPPWSCP